MTDRRELVQAAPLRDCVHDALGMKPDWASRGGVMTSRVPFVNRIVAGSSRPALESICSIARQAWRTSTASLRITERTLEDVRIRLDGVCRDSLDRHQVRRSSSGRVSASTRQLRNIVRR